MKILTTETQLRYTIERAKLIRADYHAPPAPVTPVTTEWNPLTLANATLSNNDLTNTNTGEWNENYDPQGDRVVGVLSSGKYYFEIAYQGDVDTYNDEFAIGIGSAGGNYVGFNYSSGPYGVCLFGPRFFDFYADSAYTGEGLVTINENGDGDVFGIAVDLDNHMVWMQVVAGPDLDPTNGWNGNNGDPTTGAGGIVMPPGAKTIFGTYADEDPTEALTLILDEASFQGTMPSGYTAGWPAQAFVPSITPAAWDPTTAQNVTMSNGPPPPFSGPGLTIPNLDATNNLDGPGPPGGAIGPPNPPLNINQRRYFEVTIGNAGIAGGSTPHQFNIGVATDLNSIGTYTSTVNSFSGGYGIDSRGVGYVNGGNGGFPYVDPIGHTLVTGDTIGFAIDYVTGVAWCKWVGGPGYPAYGYSQEWAGANVCSPPDPSPFTSTMGRALPGWVNGFVPVVAWGDMDNTQSCTFNFTGPFLAYLGEQFAPPYSSNSGTGTLSNNNLTFTATNSNGVGVMSCSAFANTLSSHYFEITIGSTFAGTKSSVGICNYMWEAWLCAVYTYATYGFMVYKDGNAYFNQNTFTPTVAFNLGALLPGDVLQWCVRVDTTAYVWVRVNRGGVAGNWNANPGANPVTNVGGFDISALFSTSTSNQWVFACACLASAGDSVTANFGHTTFVTQPPPFAPWENTFGAWTGTLVPGKEIETTLSNGNLTATNAYPGTAEQGVMVAATSAKTTGKYYFEVTLAVDMDRDTAIGVAVPGTDYTQFNLNGIGGLAVMANGDIMMNGSFTDYSLNRMDQMGVLALAVDLDNRMVWAKIVDGYRYWWQEDWNDLNPGEADPATNLNGMPLMAGAMVPIVAFAAFQGDSAGNMIAANFGQAPFAGQVPEGFTPGWPA